MTCSPPAHGLLHTTFVYQIYLHIRDGRPYQNEFPEKNGFCLLVKLSKFFSHIKTLKIEKPRILGSATIFLL